MIAREALLVSLNGAGEVRPLLGLGSRLAKLATGREIASRKRLKKNQKVKKFSLFDFSFFWSLFDFSGLFDFSTFRVFGSFSACARTQPLAITERLEAMESGAGLLKSWWLRCKIDIIEVLLDCGRNRDQRHRTDPSSRMLLLVNVCA